MPDLNIYCGNPNSYGELRTDVAKAKYFDGLCKARYDIPEDASVKTTCMPDSACYEKIGHRIQPTLCVAENIKKSAELGISIPAPLDKQDKCENPKDYGLKLTSKNNCVWVKEISGEECSSWNDLAGEAESGDDLYGAQFMTCKYSKAEDPSEPDKLSGPSSQSSSSQLPNYSSKISSHNKNSSIHFDIMNPLRDHSNDDGTGASPAGKDDIIDYNKTLLPPKTACSQCRTCKKIEPADPMSLGNKIAVMISFMLSPEGMAVLALQEAIFQGPAKILKGIGKAADWARSAGRFAPKADAIAAEGEDAIAQNAITGGTEVVENTTVSALAETVGEDVALESMEVMMEGMIECMVNPVMAVLFIIQITGMVLDMINSDDQSALGKMLDKDSMKKINDSFNIQFMNISMLSNLAQIRGADGTLIAIGDWPLEYFADYSLLSLIPDELSKEYENIGFRAKMMYLDALQFNSLGQVIIQLPAHKQPPMPSSKAVREFSNDMYDTFGTHNTVVTNWINKFFIIIITIFIGLIIFLLFIK